MYLLIFFLMNSLAFGITVVPRINIFTGLICREVLPLTWKPDGADGSSGATGSSINSSSSGTTTTTTTAEGPPAVVVGGFNPQCATDAVSSATAAVASIGGAIGGTLSMISGTWLSVLSDRIGRVKVVMYCAVVLLVAEAMLIVLAEAAGKGDTLAPFGYRWLWLVWIVDGLSGSFSTIMSMAAAYISDTEPEDRRNVQQGRVHGVLFIGIAVGPALSSVILKASGQESPLLVFYICIIVRTMSVFYLFFCVPESLPRKRIEDFSLRTIFPWQQSGSKSFSIKDKIGKLNPTKWLDKMAPPVLIGSAALRRNIKILVAVNVICYAGAVSAGEVLILYPQMVFKWGNLENNYFMSVINAFRAAVSWLGIPMLIFLFRKPRQLLPHHVAKPSPPTTGSPSSSSTIPDTPPTGATGTPNSSASDSPHLNLASPAPLLDDGDAPPVLAAAAATEPGDPIPPQNLYNPCPGPDALDRHLILTALLFDIFGYSGYALSPNGVLFTLCGALAAFGAIGLSTTEAALTKHVARHRVGLLMGGLGVLQAFVRIVAPAAVNAVYASSVAWWPGLAFLVVAGLLGFGVAMTGWVRVLDTREG
ncbi:major facilitator superfamily domain-containing protein [Phyllosticta citribraziliensis]|uniref:Major facilitator superfamily domain-containing protein n=1 Tax=Phyllosticta citribraziliensis TaxID=989973 RepID=A0ABR1L888_9PEZI